MSVTGTHVKNTATGVLGIRGGVHTHRGPPALRGALPPAFDVLDAAGDFIYQNAYLPYCSVFFLVFIFKIKTFPKKFHPSGGLKELKYHRAMVISAKIFRDCSKFSKTFF